MKRLGFVIGLALSANFSPSSMMASLVVSQWSLTSQVAGANTDTERFTGVENPFIESHTAIMGSSNVTTFYDLSWSGHSAVFDIISHQHMAQLDGTVAAGGRIFFSPSVDSQMTFSALYDYDWPNSVIGLSGMNVIIADLSQGMDIFVEGRQGGNVDLSPPHGSLEIIGSVVLVGGRNYGLSYAALTDQDNPSSPGTFGSADAEIHFAITPVPEPATLVFLLPAMSLRPRTHSKK